jgi:hypothetical protein
VLLCHTSLVLLGELERVPDFGSARTRRRTEDTVCKENHDPLLRPAVSLDIHTGRRPVLSPKSRCRAPLCAQPRPTTSVWNGFTPSPCSASREGPRRSSRFQLKLPRLEGSRGKLPARSARP